MEPQYSPKETISRFEKLLAHLGARGVDFAVVGGLAVILNGYSRATVDVDILIHEKAGNIRKLLECLNEWGEGFARELKPEDFRAEEGAVRVVEEFPLDIFTRMLGKTLDDFRGSLRFFETGGVRIPYLAPEDLVFLKQNSWRDKTKWILWQCEKL